MGRDLLWGEVLKFFTQRRRGAKDAKELMLILFLVFGGEVAWGQVDEGRPLRAVRPSTALSVYSSVRTAPRTPQNTLLTQDVLERELTQYYIAQYSSAGGVAWLNAVMERGSLYLPFIREEVAKRNLPPELAYLPVIESGFQITARSRSGAVGLWQFMMNSIGAFDIKVNDFVDERRDIQKSTRGALQKLQDNYKMLDNWELALAAYNCGLGALNRTIQKTKIRDYWELSKKKELKNETIHYVPKLLAAAYILSQPRRFSIDYWPQNSEWVAIPLNRQVSLEILAAEADTDRELLRRLNAELLHGISPPIDRNYRLKVPAAQVEKIREVLERTDVKLVRYHQHIVRHGDTLWSMSRHYETPLDLIEQHNPGIGNRHLRIGETVIIPAFKDVKPPSRPVFAGRLDGQHIVKKGDTLWSLGIKYGIDPQILAEENNMELNQILREGKSLKVPIIIEE